MASSSLVKLQDKLEQNQLAVRNTANMAESAAGAAIGGYTIGRFGDAGSKGVGLVGLGVTVLGIALDQPDVSSFGSGLGNAWLVNAGIEAGRKAREEAEGKAKKEAEAAAAKKAAEEAAAKPADPPSEQDFDQAWKRGAERFRTVDGGRN